MVLVPYCCEPACSTCRGPPPPPASSFSSCHSNTLAFYRSWAWPTHQSPPLVLTAAILSKSSTALNNQSISQSSLFLSTLLVCPHSILLHHNFFLLPGALLPPNVCSCEAPILQSNTCLPKQGNPILACLSKWPLMTPHHTSGILCTDISITTLINSSLLLDPTHTGRLWVILHCRIIGMEGALYLRVQAIKLLGQLSDSAY